MSFYVLCILVFVFCKQKTAYEMRISDWSSDVCSSDLDRSSEPQSRCAQAERYRFRDRLAPSVPGRTTRPVGAGQLPVAVRAHDAGEIGRASCRARVCQYV